MSQKTTLARRGFLKGVAASGAAFTLPTILTRPVFSGTTATGVNVGQIGCGNIGSNYHIPNFDRHARRADHRCGGCLQGPPRGRRRPVGRVVVVATFYK